MNDLDALSTKEIRSAKDRIQAIPSLSQLSPSSWQKELTLKQMKQAAMRANSPSSWNSIRSKSKMIDCLQEKIEEHADFVQTIRSFTFDEYVTAGKEELINPYAFRTRRKLNADSERRNESIFRKVEFAMEAAVHIIPSGSGTHLGNGWVLTCAHCVAHDDYIDSDDNDDNEEDKIGRAVELINARGETFGSVCAKVCNEADLALLKILDGDYEHISPLGCISLASKGSDGDGIDIFALGNPCDTDLEDVGRKSKNGFNPFHVSKGKLVSKLNRSEARKLGLGRQIHSAWTYWGHSGCPLLSLNQTDKEDCTVQIVGIHNSWDDRNANRHGIPLDDLWEFLRRR